MFELNYNPDNRVIIRNLNGDPIKSFCAETSWLDSIYNLRLTKKEIAYDNIFFHPSGNALIYNQKIHELYPEGTEEHIQKTCNGEITVPIYMAMRQIGSAIKEILNT